ncbi:methyl-accepting chemotaxis protein [Clostridium malenominatum]|uniref:Methyl-accepting chemotaxis protein n=1 Tax=Clostridium malenominatum TaxID=1539 RepID=A0ABN1J2Q9_9CLOT
MTSIKRKLKFKKKTNAKSMKSKLVLIMLSLTLSSLMVLSIFSGYNIFLNTEVIFTNNISENTKLLDSYVQQHISSISDNLLTFSSLPRLKNVNSTLSSYTKVTNASGEIKLEPKTPSENDLLQVLKTFALNNKGVRSILLGAEENMGYIEYPLGIKSNNYNPITEDWYQIAKSDVNKVHILDSYMNSYGEITSTLVKAIKDDNNKLKGVAAFNINLDNLNKTITNVNIGKTGFTVVVDKQGTIIAHPKNTELIGKPISNLEIAELDGTNFKERKISANVDNKNYEIFISTSADHDLGWNYISFIEKAEFTSMFYSTLFKNIIILMICALICILVSLYISNKITLPLKAVASHFRSLGNGDFTVTLNQKYMDIEDEIGIMAKSANEMQHSIKEILLNVQNSAQNLDEQSQHLFNSSEGMLMVTSDVSASIQNVSKGSSEQSTDLNKVNSLMNRFSEDLKNILDDINEVENSSSSINNLLSNSDNKMNNLSQSVESINSKFNNLVTTINTLHTNIDKITEINVFINNIAEQTNLLALNAAIEAARAGEHGRSFAVVADEVRKLAEQSKDSSIQIANIVEMVAGQSSDIISVSNEVEKNMTYQLENIDLVVSSFKDINEDLNKLIPKIHSVSDSSIKIDKERGNIVTFLENTSAISEEIAASSQEIAASSEEMNSSIERLSESAEILKDTSQNIITKLNEFKLN